VLCEHGAEASQEKIQIQSYKHRYDIGMIRSPSPDKFDVFFMLIESYVLYFTLLNVNFVR
jgi:hypothetical protein